MTPSYAQRNECRKRSSTDSNEYAELGVTFTSVPTPRVSGLEANLEFAQWVIEEIKPHLPDSAP